MTLAVSPNFFLDGRETRSRGHLKVGLGTEVAAEVPDSVMQARVAAQIRFLEKRLGALRARVGTNA